MGPTGSSLMVEKPGCEADTSSPSNAEIKKEWSCTSLPSMPSCHAMGQMCFFFYITVGASDPKNATVIMKQILLILTIQ